MCSRIYRSMHVCVFSVFSFPFSQKRQLFSPTHSISDYPFTFSPFVVSSNGTNTSNTWLLKSETDRSKEMANLQTLFQEFNLSKFIVYTCLLMFSVMFALKLDGNLDVSYWAVFMPLWIWKLLVVTGAMIGIVIWARNPNYRLSESSYIAFKSMLISLSLQLLLLMFELLVCDKLENNRSTLWTTAFIPLLFVSLLSVAIVVWSLKHDRAFELELFCALNVLQFLFIALRLDNLLSWSWVVVFVPMWVLMTLAVIGVLYALIFAAILLRTGADIAVDQRRASLNSAISYSLVVLPLLVFLFLLASKLDSMYPPINLSIHQQHSSQLSPYHLRIPPPAASLSSYSQFPSPSKHDPQMSDKLTSNHIRPSPTSSSSSSSSMLQLQAGNGATASTVQYVAQMPYFTVCTPLYLTFLILICLSFGSRGGNLCKYCVWLLSHFLTTFRILS